MPTSIIKRTGSPCPQPMHINQADALNQCIIGYFIGLRILGVVLCGQRD